MPTKRELEAGRAFLRLFLKDDMTKALARKLAGAGATLESTGQKVAATGAGIAAAGATILAPITTAVQHFASAGDELDKMSQRTGVAAPALAELGFAAEQSGVQLSDVEQNVRRMQKTIGDAERGLSTATGTYGCDSKRPVALSLRTQLPRA